MKYAHLFCIALLCTSALFGAATSGSTPSEQYRQALQQGNINAIVTAYAELPQEMRRLPEFYAPFVRALLAEKPTDEATIAMLQNIFINAQHPVLKWVLRNDRTELDQRLNQLEQEMDYYADVTASSIAATDIEELPHIEAIPHPASSMEAATSTADNISAVIATKTIKIPTLHELALQSVNKDITTKKPITTAPPLIKQLPIPAISLSMQRRPTTIQTLQMRAQKLAEDFLGVPIISAAPAQPSVTTIYSADDLHAIIASALSAEQFKKLQDYGLEKTVFDRLAQMLAKDYFLKLSPKKEGRKPEFLPAWLREHFTGVSIQDLLDYGIDFQSLRYHRAPKQLFLDNMYINDLTGLENVSGIEDIDVLVLNYNLITILESHAFASLPNLDWLFLENNQITTIESYAFAGLSKLTRLELSGNKITISEPHSFAGLTKLDSLDLRNNQITNLAFIPLAELSTLKSLKLDHNQITAIDPETIGELPRKLHAIFLGFNRITIVKSNTFYGLKKLAAIDLKNNRIATIEPYAFANLPLLIFLWLNENQITTIESDQFVNLPVLLDLYLSGNQIISIEPNSFAGLQRIKRILLQNNPIAQNPEDRARIEEEVRTINGRGQVIWDAS